ncbi:glycosyltransferase [Rhizobium sp. TRM96647]|uniref:glycosyltransferase family 2 protein n=1 Tax=unclassified Rhizobium TaxID=2613769 RepID=UPI0021E95586|nr:MULTISPECIES: glycosyltransferase family 2 protein [unclassified Rhizobium]MCV3737252.1 glycosyltransferase [Rhizobium sp. TRM96647]MCV3759236.1 glycosyltransferase [Rhizobium sp. TRM96650]
MIREVCVIIAAKNAAQTIGRAVSSALQQPETNEVIVVDDGSSDDTAGAARATAGDSDRLKILRFDENRGPAAARNEAIRASHSPILGILDADDFLLPGRFQRMLAETDWDFIADNIVFVDEARAAKGQLDIAEIAPQPRLLDLNGFIEGNISRRGVQRGEVGFLKPLIRREFLDRNELRYHEQLRLGEDYDLYARALAHGARYKIIHSCGYGAVVRGNSLSSSHRTEDLRRLYEADRAILAQPGLSRQERALIERHERHIRARYELRHFLDLKNQHGKGRAFAYAATHPAALPAIVGGILLDKTDRFRRKAAAPAALGGTGAVRYLLASPAGSSR